MANLVKSTHRADTAVEECTCFHDCNHDPETTCELSGYWHSHDDDPCPRHPQRLVARS
jgi:hypothetical protein